MPADTPTVDEVRRIVAIGTRSCATSRSRTATRCSRRRSRRGSARARTGARTRPGPRGRRGGRSAARTCVERSSASSGTARWVLHPFETLWRRLLRRGLFQPRHAPRAAHGGAAHAVRRGRARERRGRAREPEGVRGDRARVRALPPRVPARASPTPRCKRFLDGLRPGDPPDGQGYLRQAFARYERARVEPIRRRAPSSRVLANLEIGLHEQTRLQPEIRAALDAPFVTQERLGLRALEALFPSAARCGRPCGDRPPPSSASSRPRAQRASSGWRAR